MKTRFPTNKGQGFRCLNTGEKQVEECPVRVVAAV
jgi:hypothetical protein